MVVVIALVLCKAEMAGMSKTRVVGAIGVVAEP